MKLLLVSMALWSAILPLSAQDQEEAGIPAETGIPGPIADGTPTEPAPLSEPLKFRIQSTVTHRVNVEEAPEMAGLPPVKGTINVNVQLVKDPKLLDPPPPLPALPPDDPAVLARMAELREHYQGTELVFVSATIYDHSRTLLRCYPSGGASKEISGWSNLDFNCFSGFATYQVNGMDGEVRQYGLMMGIGNEDTKQRAELLAKHDRTYNAPEIPKLPDLATDGPAFVVTEGDASDKDSMAVITGMHDLYRVEGPRMEAAYQARIKAEDERRTYLLANPPVPQDVTIQFWKRAVPSPAGVKNLEEGAKP